MTLANIDIAIICLYAVSIFVLAQWVSREKGTHKKNRQKILADDDQRERRHPFVGGDAEADNVARS